MVIWLIGLAGAGKSVIGNAVAEKLRRHGMTTVLLDGDRFRDVVGDKLGHSLDERRINGTRMCRMSQFLEQQNVAVVACVLSNFPDQQKWNRENLSQYLEVFIDVPMETLEARDQKQLYSGARSGTIKNVVGVDIPFVRPPSPDLVLTNDSDGKIGEKADIVLHALQERGWLTRA